MVSDQNPSTGGSCPAASEFRYRPTSAATYSCGSPKLGPREVTANTIAPGYIVEGTNFFLDSLSNERRGSLIAATHTKRAGTPDDVAGLAFFLADSEARQITGQTIHVNGGAHNTR